MALEQKLHHLFGVTVYGLENFALQELEKFEHPEVEITIVQQIVVQYLRYNWPPLPQRDTWQFAGP